MNAAASKLDYAKKRLLSLLHEVESLKLCDFPFEHSEDALASVEAVLRRKVRDVDKVTLDHEEAFVDRACAMALEDAYVYLPLLGFLLRSTDSRNSFEVFWPLLRLAGNILEPEESDRSKRKTKIVLSSEWDYSPFIYIYAVPELRDFILIGLPASEAANPLLIPLAGHELGHLLWSKLSLKAELSSGFSDQVRKRLPSLGKRRFAKDSETQGFVTQRALSQAEESFSDFVGLRLFSQAYLHAFAYLLSPTFPRSFEYPDIVTRVDNLSKASKVYNIRVPGGYREMFESSTEHDIGPVSAELLAVADTVRQSAVDELIDIAEDAVAHGGVTVVSDRDSSKVFKRFEGLVPAEDCEGLSHILNAAWRAYNDIHTLWNDMLSEGGKVRDKLPMLKELVLKNIEIYEFEQRMKAGVRHGT